MRVIIIGAVPSMIDLTVIYFNKKNLFQNLSEKTELLEEILIVMTTVKFVFRIIFFRIVKVRLIIFKQIM